VGRFFILGKMVADLTVLGSEGGGGMDCGLSPNILSYSSRGFSVLFGRGKACVLSLGLYSDLSLDLSSDRSLERGLS
jgi:hypothetical protein